ncbi:MAG TPA: adenylate/guanylate cyclase domain-containing protein [Blastocatellia bacterium]|nr:adenylate/guanylate cyclase domain-containing protein [Blastocatellia bacterium]
MPGKDFFNKALSVLYGDPRHLPLEHRLFNTISMLNAVANIGGALVLLGSRNHNYVLLLHLGTGILFLAFYYFARFRNTYRALYWPFVLVILVFLFLNALANGGSLGGAHYYFIPALVISAILSTRLRTTVIAFALFGAAALALLVLEYIHPEWITPEGSASERLFDISSNLVFVEAFTGVLVMVLARNLNQERRLSDRLLLNVLPERVAKELKANGRSEPLQYDSASVLFTDFVGFTRIAETLTPRSLIEELDLCFSSFDEIAKARNLEKIKTIGDSYMAAGGIPTPNRTHPVDSVLAALEIQDFMEGMREKKEAERSPYWQLRLGIHTGPLVAGVIGREKFAYDVWGDTVNTASRLESAGVPGRVNVSEATYEIVKDFFACEYRGKVAAKNKGEIDMYFVNAIRLELSEDAEGKKPNRQFFAKLEELRGGISAINPVVDLACERS